MKLPERRAESDVAAGLSEATAPRVASTGRRAWLGEVGGAAGLAVLSAMGVAGCRPEGAPILMLAAASLRAMTARWLDLFQWPERGPTVQASFGGSQQLRALLEAGALADVFASADVSHLDALTGLGICGPARPLAGNRLALIAPASGARNSVGRVTDLSRLSWNQAIMSAQRVAIGDVRAPIGRYTRSWLTQVERAREVDGAKLAAHFQRAVVSRDPSVGQILARLLAGEVDLAVVYQSDAHELASQVVSYRLPESLQVETQYAISVIEGSSRLTLANAFVEFLLSQAGQRELRRFGFEPASPLRREVTDRS